MTGSFNSFAHEVKDRVWRLIVHPYVVSATGSMMQKNSYSKRNEAI